MNDQPRSRFPLHFSFLLVTLLLLLAVASCVSLPVDRPWAYADLRTLDTLDAISPATDILAVYTRASDLRVDIRVDLLDINAGDKYALRVTLWDNESFSQNPLIIDVSSTGIVQTNSFRAGMPPIRPRVVQNPWLDTVVLNLNRYFIGDRYHLDVSTYTTDPFKIADQVLNVHSDASPPVSRAPVLLAFWDAFPVSTPAQALRRWDGAHTGPLGDRHGLLHILKAAGQYRIPVALLDIKNPSSLAALDFMGNVSKLKDLYAQGLLVLPDVAYGAPADKALEMSLHAAAGFDLPESQFIYAPSPDSAILSGYRACFLPLADDTHLANSRGVRLVPLPSEDAVEATKDGLSLDVRHRLIQVAISPEQADLVVLGGSLPHSTWGDSDMAYPSFEWIASHPWIKPLAALDILTFPARTRRTLPTPVKLESSWLEGLRSAPINIITLSAWQTYMMLTAPTADARLYALKNAYLGQLGEVLAAADWTENQIPRSECTPDLNGDGRPECILADRKYLAILETSGARLTHFFFIDENGPHQIIGPSSQFTVGLSDPSEWHPERGEAADPSVIPGAFADDNGTWSEYTPTIHADGITFTDPETGRVKTYRLTENGIRVSYLIQGPLSTRIPLALDPQAFYSGPTSYQATLAPHAWTWSLSAGNSVEVRTGAALSADDFTSAIPFIALPEDPNQDYPRGNYLPFPLSVVTIQSDGPFSVTITPK